MFWYNILGQDVTVNTQGNLTVESRQNSYNAKSKTFGVSLGGSIGKRTDSGSINFGVNYSSGKTDRLWVDNQTGVIGTNSVNINTGNDTNIRGAVLGNITNAVFENGIITASSVNSSVSEGSQDFKDGGNLNLNTKTLTFSNLYDYEYSKTSGAGISRSIGVGANNSNGQGSASSNNPNQQNNFYPEGSTTISINNGGYKKEQTTNATIGQGNIKVGSSQVFDNSDSSTSSYGDLASSTGGTLVSSSDGTINDSSLSNLNRDISNSQEITRDTITNALNITTTFDNRLLSGAGIEQIAQEMGSLPTNLKKEVKMDAKLLDAPLVAAATSDIKGLSYVASWVAGEGGSVATLVTQILGLNYLLDSGNTRFQNNVVENLDNETLAKAIQGKDGFSLEQRSGYETEGGKKVNFFTITDKDGNQQTFRYTSDFKNLSDVTKSDLINTKDYSLHGVDNTSDEAVIKGLMQLGTLTNYKVNEKNGTSESSFVTLNAPTKGLINDSVENIYNTILGKTPFASANINQLQDFSQTLGQVAKDNNLTNIRFVGHSNGGDRLYLGVLNGAAENKAFEGTDIKVQFYGTPSLTKNLQDAATNAGMKDSENSVLHIINKNDPVANILGRNVELNPILISKSLATIPTLGSTKLSPHSNYYCEGSFCNFDSYNKLNSSQ